MPLPLSLNLGFFSDIAATRKIAEERGLGLEIQHFADGPLLDGAWRDKVKEIKAGLSGFKGFLSMHGPFSNMDLGGWDPQVNAVTRGRFLHALQIAKEIDVKIMVLHSAYDYGLRFHGGVKAWSERRIPYWRDLATIAEVVGVTIVLENTHEPDPSAQIALIDAVNSPALRACIDTGHCNMTGTTPIDQWIDTLGDRLVYVHAHNNSGTYDDHWPLDKGTLNAAATLKKLASLPKPPRVTLELRNLADQMASLKFIDSLGKL